MKITTLVPAYKPKYLSELLMALQLQTLRPERVIFSDDSAGQDFVHALSRDAAQLASVGLKVEVLVGPRQGAWANFRHLLQHFQGETEFFHLQLDDDIPYPQFYERHAQAHALGRATCAVSRRWSALESGQPFSSLSVPSGISDHGQRLLSLSADLLFQSTVAGSINWLGEFSNATFRAEMRDDLLRTRIAGVSYAGLEDIGAFLQASMASPLIFINEHLGYFRHSPEQNTSQKQGRTFKLCVLAWIALALAARRLGQIDAAACAGVALRVGAAVLQHYPADPAMVEIATLAQGLATLDPAAEAAYLRAWHTFSGSGAEDSKLS